MSDFLHNISKTKEEIVSLLMENTQCDREQVEKIVEQYFIVGTNS